jgi:AraC-like DNA-binding protein
VRRPAYPQLSDVDWLRRRYLGQGPSVADVAAHLGCTARTMYKALKTAGIPRRGAVRVHPVLTDHDSLRRRYLVEDPSIHELAARVGCQTITVRRALADASITLRRRHYRRRFPSLDDQAWLRGSYVDETATLGDLASEIGCSITAVRQALLRADIPTRPPGSYTRPSKGGTSRRRDGRSAP